jgi:hypothetical protein
LKIIFGFTFLHNKKEAQDGKRTYRGILDGKCRRSRAEVLPLQDDDYV